MPLIRFLLIFFLAATPSPIRAASISPLTHLGANLREGFLGRDALLLQAAGVGATWGLIETGADWRTEQYFYHHPTLSYAFDPVAATGALGPVALPITFLVLGAKRDDAELYGAGCALAQANAAVFLYTSAIKAFTGRPHPDPASAVDIKEQSRTFRPGFLRGGIFWGWPSGHTTATMATVACLANYYPGHPWWSTAGYAYVAYTAIGVAAVGGGHMHWLSEGAAGALMSYALGAAVGVSFRHAVEGEKAKVSGAGVGTGPLLKPGLPGWQVTYRF